MVIIDKPKVFRDETFDDVHVRVFNKADSDKFEWHTDKEDRVVYSVCDCKGWYIQLDNERPVELGKESFFIKKGVYHRILCDSDASSELYLGVVFK